MALYVYKCSRCGRSEEALRRMGDGGLPYYCRSCGELCQWLNVPSGVSVGGQRSAQRVAYGVGGGAAAEVGSGGKLIFTDNIVANCDRGVVIHGGADAEVARNQFIDVDVPIDYRP